MSRETPSLWAQEMAGVVAGDEQLASDLDGFNLVLNRMRLATFLSRFADDKNVQDFLLLDVIAASMGLPVTSTGIREEIPSLALRSFRLWEYVWLYKALRLGGGGLKVLDLGGPASHLSILAALAGCHVTSIDINPDFVRASQECARLLQVSLLNACIGDMRDLSAFADETFDVVVSCSVLEHLVAEDQIEALRQMARVLKRGGTIGITFDIGTPAPGANEYLPPPHDPPPDCATALHRYVQGDLILLGGDYAPDRIVAGTLFQEENVKYSIASMFLGKPPLAQIDLPRPDSGSSVLGHIRLQKLPYEVFKTATSLRNSLLHTEIFRVAAVERLADLEQKQAALTHIAFEADKRAKGMQISAAAIVDRDQRISMLQGSADERLAGLLEKEKLIEDLKREAEERGAALEKAHSDAEYRLQELNSLIRTKEVRLEELERVAEERRMALEAAYAEAERGRQEFSLAIKARDERISELDRVAEERRLALEATDAAAKRGQQEFARAIEERNELIGELDRMANERLAALTAIHEKLRQIESTVVDRDNLIAHLEDVQRSIQAALDSASLSVGSLERRIAEFELETVWQFIRKKMTSR